MRRKNSVDLPSQAELERLLEYNHETGLLFWKARTPDMFELTKGRTKEHSSAQWNARWAGKEALSKINDGYKMGSINYQPVSAHRVIWKLITGEEPEILDHINGIRDDNRFSNLRNGSDSSNRKNTRKRVSNRPYTGVMKDKKSGKWVVTIQVGTYEDLDEAVAARKHAESLLGYHPNHGREAILQRND